MLRIVCDPSSGSIELYLLEIIRSGSQMFVLCFVGVWQRDYAPKHRPILNLWCVCTVPYLTHTHRRFKITLPNTDQAQDKHL